MNCPSLPAQAALLLALVLFSGCQTTRTDFPEVQRTQLETTLYPNGVLVEVYNFVDKEKYSFFYSNIGARKMPFKPEPKEPR